MDCILVDQGLQKGTELPFPVGDRARTCLDGLLRFLQSKAGARCRLGIADCVRLDGAAWLLRTTSHAGGFALKPRSGPAADSAADGEEGLGLRYFPAPSEPVFSRFSTAERDARLNGGFDHTGAPLDEMDERLFHIAELTILPHDEVWFGLRLNAQDVARRDRQTAGGGRSVERTVPALALGLAVFDRLICSLACAGRQGPSLVRVWRRPGQVTVLHADGAVGEEPLGYFGDWSIEAWGLRRPWSVSDRLDPPPAPPARLADAPVASHEGPEPPLCPPSVVNPIWWEAANW